VSQRTLHEEEVLGKAYDSRLMRRLLAYLKPYKIHVAVSVGLLLAISVVQLVGPYITKLAIDRYIATGDMAGLGQMAILFMAVLFLEFILQVSQIYLLQWIGQNVMYDLRARIFAHLQNLSLRFFDRNPVGRLVTRVTTDVESLHEMLSSGVVAIFGDIFTLTGIVIFLLALNWKLALVAFSVLPLLFYTTFLFRRKVRESYRDIRIRIARINSFLQENIVGMPVVQIFNREQRNFERFDQLNHDHLQAHLRTIFYYAVFFPAVQLISALALALIIWYGGSQVIRGMLTFGSLVAFIQLAQRFFRPISDLSEKYNIMQSAMASSERIFKLLDTEPEIVAPPNPRRLGRVRGDIVFDHVWFAYKGEEYVLRDISFEVKAGEKIAFVGHTGAGKTSLINLLARFYDVQRGAILVDGVDIRELDPKELRRNIGIVLQDVFLFAGTVEYNIRLGNHDITKDRVIQAARDVHAHRFIERLPHAYQEDVRERGSTLSLGQRQLLAFARALAFDPAILVLDEATSSVDTETELLIQDALRRLMEGRTSLIIAHRLSTIQNADRIIVLHKGQIREIGNHQELLAKGGIYYRLYQLQYADQERQKRIVA
jgi:ATP-binding cassette subfamily B protein